MFSTNNVYPDKDSVYELLTSLCEKTSSKYNKSNRMSQKMITAKIRSSAYEIILKKSSTNVSIQDVDPFLDLSLYILILQNSAQNTIEYKRFIELKDAVNTLKNTDFGEEKSHIHNVLKLLNGLRDTDKQNITSKLFQRPFSFGLFEKMLPKPKREVFGSCQPYSYYPSHVFELPFSLQHHGALLDNKGFQCCTESTVDAFESKSLFYDASQKGAKIKTFFSPMSLNSMTLTNTSPYTDIMINCPGLMAPRNLQIPTSISPDTNIKVSLPPTNSEVEEVFRGNMSDSIDIRMAVPKFDQNDTDDIWDYVSKLPPVNNRQIIATSAREISLWRQVYKEQLPELNIVSEKLLIRHIMYLIIGIETSSFPYSEEFGYFYMNDNLVLEGISKELLNDYALPLVAVGTYYKRLSDIAFNINTEDNFQSKGLIYKAAKDFIRRYLLDFRLTATRIFEEYYNTTEDDNRMPTLLQIRHHIEPLEVEIEIIASVFKQSGSDPFIPSGADLISHLFNMISLVTHKKAALILCDALFYICKVYFKFIERFIFEGELDDPYNEFFIRKDNQHVNSRSKRYWDKGFYMVPGAIPEFLRPLATCILLCGKSLRLLKLCNPGDPLVALVSVAHPAVRGYRSAAGLECAQRELGVYRTRCMFVAGERACLRRLLLRRDNERRAFAELASLKQAETMDKIIAERKRLAQLIIAEKQHSLKVLEAAMAEAKATKDKAKQRERKLHELAIAAEKATEEVDSKLKVDESNKIMEYYSKLDMEVEKSKLHTEWKIKRLQLDASRMQLLSTEERNLKREKLELEHQRNEDIMAMSIQSLDTKSEDELGSTAQDNESVASQVVQENTVNKQNISIKQLSTAVCNDNNNARYLKNIPTNVNKESVKDSHQNVNAAKHKAQSYNYVFSAICNVAKSIFGDTKQTTKDSCDNEVKFDAEGNIVKADTEMNFETNKVSNDNKMENTENHLRYLERKQAVLQTKLKVMAHEMGNTDLENNQIKSQTLDIQLSSVDKENNVDGKWSRFDEAQKNRLKVLGTELDETDNEPLLISNKEPINVAHREAILNKHKVLEFENNQPVANIQIREPANVAQEEAVVNRSRVLGVEFNLPAESRRIKKPANVAQEEAIANKNKVLGVQYNLPKENKIKRLPANIAQEEAVLNKKKILGVEYNLPPEHIITNDPANVAQEEAVLNKKKVLGVEYNLPPEHIITNDPANVAQEEAVLNKKKVLGVEYNLLPEHIITNDPANVAQEEAVLNKKKVLGVEYNLPPEHIITNDPANVAQEEAVLNKKKVLGVEYNLPPEHIITNDPANVAQEEAVLNKKKVLGVEYNLPPEHIITNDPANVAQEEAVLNKKKVLGVEYNLPPEHIITNGPANVAQEEAVLNKKKVLGVEYNLPPEHIITNDPANVAQEEAVLNKKKVLGVEYNLPPEHIITNGPANVAQEEAVLNKKKVLGVEYNLPPDHIVTNDPANFAQEEAILNKKKILGVECNLPVGHIAAKEPANLAQEEAIRNRNKIHGSECVVGTENVSARFDSTRKSNLRLNLKPCNNSNKNSCITPNTAVTPGEFIPGSAQLDLETPTTAEMPMDGAITGDILSPKNNYSKGCETADVKTHKEYLTSDGFNFSLIVDEETESGHNDIPETHENSPSKTGKNSIINILDGSYNLDSFDPFGVKDHNKYEKNYFDNRMNTEKSFYTHPAVIMENLKKSPRDNVFASRFDPESEEEEEEITCDSIVTLTSCLQRSVMLPLTYQLEVVNNSILTYFLINLDMYEHLKSLKDYFFLMDGEFSRSICHNLFSKLSSSVNPEEVFNFATLHNILDEALGSSVLHSPKFSANLSFSISSVPLTLGTDALRCVSLTYAARPPLTVMLSPDALARYECVFHFLIKMKRAGWVLGECFQNLKLSVKLLKLDSRKLVRSHQYKATQIYRHIMSSMIRSLDNYIMTTCIFPSWTEFEADLKKATTLDDLYDCHVVYVKKVLFMCLLNNRSAPVMKLLNDMFAVILKFSRFLKASDWQESDGCYTHPHFAQLNELFHLFEKVARYLLKVLARLTDCGYQRHLGEFITAVNLNGYYTTNKPPPTDDTTAIVQKL